MSTTDQSPKHKRHWYQFSLKTLLLAVTLVSCVLAVNRWLGPPWGWMTAFPLGVIGLLAMYTRRRSMLGCIVGSVTFCVIAYLLFINWEPSDLRFLKCMVVVGSYGGAAGSSIHAIVLKRWIVGGVLLLGTIAALVAIWDYPIE